MTLPQELVSSKPQDRRRATKLSSDRKDQPHMSKTTKAEKRSAVPEETKQHNRNWVSDPSKAALKAFSKYAAVLQQIEELKATAEEQLAELPALFEREAGFSFNDADGTFRTIMPKTVPDGTVKWFLRGVPTFVGGQHNLKGTSKAAAKPSGKKAAKKAAPAEEKKVKAVKKAKKGDEKPAKKAGGKIKLGKSAGKAKKAKPAAETLEAPEA